MPRTKNLGLRRKRINFGDLQRYIAITMGSLLVVFIVAQFVVLDLAGIHGPEITSLRNEQEELKLEIELKRAEMNELTKSQDVKTYATTDLGYKATSVKVIKIVDAQDQNSITAQN
ncbi:MAG: hypothetical protein US52_C0054G0004 [candidate division WS6 bacterium GW2011_GWA2_37_6]|uniref:Uncharacterized protein n=1 Tax=candidate division WS6 bacterium GW2011_GWA2_37_6 TaxID=1619087 RepID=A0A0G0GWV0_9BACT|nr:MAG: hypothetical protein US52_C0054G0004 [candidate division WS6 bacterium GW2011_GWA2_37_6]